MDLMIFDKAGMTIDNFIFDPSTNFWLRQELRKSLCVCVCVCVCLSVCDICEFFTESLSNFSAILELS